MGIAREWAGRAPNDEGRTPQEKHRLKVTMTLEPSTTLAEVHTWVGDRGLQPDMVIITGGHLTYEREETTEEYEHRTAAKERADRRMRESLVERYEALFGDTKPSKVKEQ